MRDCRAFYFRSQLSDRKQIAKFSFSFNRFVDFVIVARLKKFSRTRMSTRDFSLIPVGDNR